MAPRGAVFTPTLKSARLPLGQALSEKTLRPLLLDLRPPQTPIQAAVAETVWPSAPAAALPIPARKPLSGLAWVLAGGVSAAILGSTVISAAKAINSPVQAKVAPAAAVATTPAPTAAAQAPAPVFSVTSAQIQSLLNDFAASAGSPVYLAVKDLKTGQGAAVASDQTITSASLYKLFVAHGIYTLVDSGKLNFSSIVPGTGSNVSNCLKAMITVSDNACGEAMEGMLGDSRYNPTLAQYGFTHTRFDYPTVTSANDVAILLERLYNSTLLSPNATQYFTDLLKSQRVNNRLPQGLPAGTTIAHKTGDVFGLVHDAGIVYGPKTDYVVVMMSGPWKNTGAAPAKFAELSSKLYTLFNQ